MKTLIIIAIILVLIYACVTTIDQRDAEAGPKYVANWNACAAHLHDAMYLHELPLPTDYIQAQVEWENTHVCIVSIRENGKKVERAGMTPENLKICLAMR